MDNCFSHVKVRQTKQVTGIDAARFNDNLKSCAILPAAKQEFGSNNIPTCAPCTREKEQSMLCENKQQSSYLFAVSFKFTYFCFQFLSLLYHGTAQQHCMLSCFRIKILLKLIASHDIIRAPKSTVGSF